MRFFVANEHSSHVRLIVSLVVGSIFGGSFASTPVGAQSTVQAIICQSAAALTIDQPESDSIATSLPIVVTGSVSQATQIEVRVDGQFNSIVPLSASATTYSASVQVSAGTHTIALEAVDVCQIGNATGQVVVTYQPQLGEPSIGDQTPTSVPADAGVVVGQGDTLTPLTSTASTSVAQFLQPFINIGRTLDLVPSEGTYRLSVISPLLRLALVSAGLATIVFSSQLAILSAHHLAPRLARARIFGRHRFILLGLAFLLVAFLLA